MMHGQQNDEVCFVFWHIKLYVNSTHMRVAAEILQVDKQPNSGLSSL
jgi:hypothetical protein